MISSIIMVFPATMVIELPIHISILYIIVKHDIKCMHVDIFVDKFRRRKVMYSVNYSAYTLYEAN